MKRLSHCLPDSLSDLVDAAVSDAERVEAMPGYALDMEWWHEPTSRMSDAARANLQEGAVCAVCMAGAVMVCRLGAQPHEVLFPDRYGGRVEEQLLAVNCVRIGSVDRAAGLVYGLGFGERVGEEQLAALRLAADVIRMDFDGDRAPWATYRRAATILREAGL